VPEIIVVGGGIAGMGATLRLLERGCRVTLFESSDRLGGKAGSNRHGADFDDHAYHIFPAWYRNIWQLVEDLGIADNFVDCADIVEIRRGEFPERSYTYHNITSWLSGPRNLFARFIPPSEMFLFYYALADLLSQPYSRRARLDQISVTGFIRSKFYATKSVERQFQELILKGLSVPLYDVSSMTMAQVMNFWVTAPLPLFRIPKGSLQQYWIGPIQARMEELGLDLRLEHHLERIDVAGQRIVGLDFSTSHTDARRRIAVSPDSRVVLAIPSPNAAELVDDDVYRAAPELGDVRKLHSVPLAAFNIYFNRRIPEIPKAHVLLAESRFALSFIDVSQTWQGQDTTVLNCMASDFEPLLGLSEKAAYEALFVELREFLPMLSSGDVDHVDFQPHVDEPLFMNDVGAWAFRPTESAATRLRRTTCKHLENLYLAGDYCRSPVDLVSMEDALSTGLIAAEAIRKDAGLTKPVTVLEPFRSPAWIWRLVKAATLPTALALKLLVEARGAKPRPVSASTNGSG
jgi:phytoene dehydrogenase-like protein